MQEKTSTYTLRIQDDLKKAFEMAAKSEDMTGAQLVRRWIRSYVENYMKHHAQADLLKQGKEKK